ncbi:MAG: aldose 1-epimerase family protein [Ruminiclostridium sp.]|nr:aldose 1-epimerase family protein [Ruminiclostridium sp.]
MDIKLTSGSASAVILEKGAELRSLDLSGKEIMWRADPAFWGKSSPLLFPMIGNLRGGKTVIDGKEYEITKHGFARDNVFEAKQISDSEAQFTFVSNENTKKSFPFDFRLTLKYNLCADKLVMLYTVENTGSSVMPFCIGAHPAFACPNEDGAQFTDYKLVFEKNETVKSPVMNLVTRMWGDNDRIERLDNSNTFALEYSLFDNDCVYFDTISSKSVSLVCGKSGHGIKLNWSGFETLGVWTPDHKNAPFVCIEPWCGCDDYDTDNGVFADKRGIQSAAPGEKKEYSLTIEEI